MFFRAPDQWTARAELAENFGNSPKAILFARERALQGLEVFWDFDDPEYNVRLPIVLEDGEPLKEAA